MFMDIFISLLSGGISSLLYGLICTGFIMTTIYFLLKNLSKGSIHSIPFFIAGIVLFVALTVNLTTIIGAFMLKGQTTAMQIWLTQQLNGMEQVAGIQDSQYIGEELIENFPLLGCFFNLFDLSGHSYSELPQAFYDLLNDELNGIIWSKTFWSLGFIIAAVLVALYFEKGNPAQKRRNKRQTYVSSPNYNDF